MPDGLAWSTETDALGRPLAMARAAAEAGADQPDRLGELRRLTRLRHPNLRAALRAGLDQDGAFVAFETGPAESWDARARGGAPRYGVSSALRREVRELRLVLAALVHAHAEGAAHGAIDGDAIRYEGASEPVLADWHRAGGFPPADLREEAQAADCHRLGAVLYRVLTGVILEPSDASARAEAALSLFSERRARGAVAHAALLPLAWRTACSLLLRAAKNPFLKDRSLIGLLDEGEPAPIPAMIRSTVVLGIFVLLGFLILAASQVVEVPRDLGKDSPMRRFLWGTAASLLLFVAACFGVALEGLWFGTKLSLTILRTLLLGGLLVLGVAGSFASESYAYAWLVASWVFGVVGFLRARTGDRLRPALLAAVFAGLIAQALAGSASRWGAGSGLLDPMVFGGGLALVCGWFLLHLAHLERRYGSTYLDRAEPPLGETAIEFLTRNSMLLPASAERLLLWLAGQTERRPARRR